MFGSPNKSAAHPVVNGEVLSHDAHLVLHTIPAIASSLDQKSFAISVETPHIGVHDLSVAFPKIFGEPNKIAFSILNGLYANNGGKP